MSAPSRKAALLRLAAIHDIDPGDQTTTSAEDLRAFLDAPATIREWVAVTVSPETGIVYLRPEFRAVEHAQRAASGFVRDDLYQELPLEVVNLDTGEAIGCELEPRWGESRRVDSLLEVIRGQGERRESDEDS